jgi:type IV pilus assembly protein PilC
MPLTMNYDAGTTPDSEKEIMSDSEHRSIWSKEINLFRSRKSYSFNCRFFSESALLIEAGVDIHKALEIIGGTCSKDSEKATLMQIEEAVVNGSTLSEALDITNRFAKYDIMTIAIGEETGELPTVLKSLSNYYSKKIAQRRQIIGALSYPLLVLMTTILSMVFMFNYIIPMFEDVFKRFNGKLPPLTRSVIALSDTFNRIGWVILLILVILSATAYICRRKDWYRSFASMLREKTPIVKDISLLTYKVRFCQTLALLVSSRVHLQEALRLIKDVIGYYPLEKALSKIIEDISSGKSLSEAITPFRFFDKKMISMTLVGEEVNKLDVIYEQLSTQYSNELDVKIKSMNSLLEPVLIIFVGAIVGVILISMYLPIFQLGLNMGQ